MFISVGTPTRATPGISSTPPRRTVVALAKAAAAKWPDHPRIDSATSLGVGVAGSIPPNLAVKRGLRLRPEGICRAMFHIPDRFVR